MTLVDIVTAPWWIWTVAILVTGGIVASVVKGNWSSGK